MNLSPAPGLLDDPPELEAFTRWPGRGRADAASQGPGRVARVAESSLRLGGLRCVACAGSIEAALRRTPGVLDARVSAASAIATVRWDADATRASALVSAIEEAGYSAVPDTAAAARSQRLAEARTALWRLFVAAFCAMQVMMLAAPAYLGAPGDLAPDLKRLLDRGSWLLTLPVLCFAAAPFFGGAWRALRQRRIGMDVPVALGIAVAFIASSGAAFDPQGPFGHEVWFDSLTMFISFLLAGRFLEMRARHRAEVALEDATDRLPQSVMRLDAEGVVQIVSARRLQPGDRVRVPLGQAFAADGVLIEGSTAVDESLLTGESRALPRRSGDAVIAGSLNLQAPVTMRVERCGAGTRYEAIVALMRAARSQRPAMLASADRWAAPFLKCVLLLAALAAAAWSWIDPTRVPWVVVSVLIVTCPCALSLAAPSALLAAAGALARRGILLRRLDALQGLATMQTLFVDKTGTLTEGRLQCIAVQPLRPMADVEVAQLRGIAAAIAQWSTHPLSLALRDGIVPAGTAWLDVQEQAGCGLEARDDAGGRWRLGAPAWAGLAGVEHDAAAHVGLSRDGVPLLRFTCSERLRDDAAEAVQALQADGVRVCLLSGDGSGRVARLAQQLGLDGAAGGLAPGAKLAALRAAQQRGEIVAMLGDGINDGPVLAQADVSLAMGEGALVARAQADGVLVSNRLGDVAAARTLARRTMRVLRQNFAWAAFYNAACVPMALAGWLPPWAAGLGMAASSSFVVLNSLRLAR